ncbi:sensor histidine kinase [Allostreptomyces psammosilenae]|uniref:histidine kinase n=1 Tax=Allostreptomyces psammosilenae TaxID=1892865 RepID=A0A852ZMB3_9ACTN|nr:ATP-binding protein [Allostreptomyces psammosilenae]NYI03543.1 sensor histidine kinase regulating citrate/malate metabolism [Allostreptomyces psammosilenae]
MTGRAKEPTPRGDRSRASVLRPRRSRAGTTGRPRGRHATLAGQLLAFQFVIVAAVVTAVAWVSLAQTENTFERVEGRRALAIAENVAANALLRDRLANPPDGADDGRSVDRTDRTVTAVAEDARAVSGASFVIVARPDRVVLAAPDPDDVGHPLAVIAPEALAGRAATATAEVDGARSVVAYTPVLADGGAVVGVVAVGHHYPTTWEAIAAAAPDLAVHLGVAAALGAGGSLLLARRVKRQTLGLEPRSIAALVQEREAMLGGLREGVLACDPDHRVTLVNAGARELLGLPADCVGRHLSDLGLPPEVAAALAGTPAPGSDQVLVVAGRALVVNRMPIARDGRELGSVTTLRDRSELLALQQELGSARNLTDTLRAQTHEFANQLHTISGLIQLREYDEAVRFISGLARTRARLNEDVTARVADPALAALLIAKASLAAERGVAFRLAPDTSLGRGDEQTSADLVTVVGNLVDNALDAVEPLPGASVEVLLSADADGTTTVTVRDTGPGFPEELMGQVLARGVSTKQPTAGHGARGVGLALVRMVCSRRGGTVELGNDGGAVVTVRLPPLTAATPAAEGAPAEGVFAGDVPDASDVPRSARAAARS